jgi:hypothetical protein
MLIPITLTGLGTDLNDPEVPFKFNKHFITVRATIDGYEEELSLALDTGSMTSVVDKKVTKALGLKGKKIKAKSFGGKQKAKSYTLPQLCLEEVCFEEVPAISTDLRFTEVDGLIGLDLMKRYNFEIDFEARKIVFGSASSNISSVAFPGVLPLVIIGIQSGEKRLSFMLDSGSEETILFKGRSSREVVPMEKTGQKLQVSGVGARKKAELVYLKEISMGDTSWTSHPAYLVETKQRPIAKLDGLLALSSLELKRLSFDFDNNRVSWER